MTRWIFLGDESRRIFVGWILKLPHEEIDENKSLTLRRGSTPLETTTSEENIIFSSYNLPPGVEIFVPCYSDGMKINPSDFDNCAIFEMFPFGRESTEDFARLVESGKKKPPAILFVMMDVVDNEDNSPVGLTAMKSFFLKKNRDTLTARDESDVLEILHWHRPLAADVIKLMRREVQDIDNNSEKIFEDYENFLDEQKKSGCLSEKSKNKIVSFSSVKGKTHIWMSYRDAALKILSGGVKDLIALYRKIIYQDEQSNSLASMIWDANVDCSRLEKKIFNRFIELMKTPKNFQGLLNDDETYSEHTYLSQIRRGSRFGGIDENFLSAYENFLKHEAREIFTAEIDSHINKLKKMV